MHRPVRQQSLQFQYQRKTLMTLKYNYLVVSLCVPLDLVPLTMDVG
jgi:hypothetical protein